MKKYLIYILSSAILFVSGCDDFGDTNVNPNATTVPLTSALLTNALVGIPATNTNAALYAQYYSQTQYTDASLYTTQDVNWSGEMAGSLYDIQKIIDLNNDPATKSLSSLEGSNNNQIAIARILKAYRFSILTDRYGDMPYSQALKGELQPAFDTQEFIYKDIFKELDEAVNQFEDAGDKVKGDILFDANGKKTTVEQADAWRRFANSLRVVLALRISNKDEAMGKAEYAKALSAKGGLITSNTQNVSFSAYPGGAFKNPYFALANDWAVSETVSDILNGTIDERRKAFGKPNGSNTLVGVPYGLKREDAVKFIDNYKDWSKILNDDWRKETSAVFFLTYADVLLARAEARQRGWAEETVAATTLYADGIKASWEQWNVYNATAFGIYMARTDIALSGGNELAKIGTQRWLAFYPNGNQGWAEWRRTGFPSTVVATPNAVNNSKQIPRRLIYPSFEYGVNGTNVSEAAARIGGDRDDTKVWWNSF
jgi:hypothetical protein